jgi:hypothetical protein
MVCYVSIFSGVARCDEKKPIDRLRSDVGHQRAMGPIAIRRCQNATAFAPEQRFHLVDHIDFGHGLLRLFREAYRPLPR